MIGNTLNFFYSTYNPTSAECSFCLTDIKKKFQKTIEISIHLDLLFVGRKISFTSKNQPNFIFFTFDSYEITNKNAFIIISSSDHIFNKNMFQLFIRLMRNDE